MIEPHGGKLVERLMGEKTKMIIRDQASEFTKLQVSPETAKDVKNIAYGVYSPLEGFSCENDFLSILTHSRLESDVPWTIPIVLDVDEKMIRGMKPGDEILLTTSDGGEETIIATMELEDMFEYDKDQYAESVFGTKDTAHPGVKKVMGREDTLIGGPIHLLDEVKGPHAKYNLKPKETRVLFHKKGWESVVAFQTRNPPHLGHEHVQKASLTVVDGLLINPVIGKKKQGDFLDTVILKAYETLIQHYYPKDSVVLSTFETEMHYAGPKEAIHHSIARKNLGCTHFIVGRDHAGVGDYYGPFDAHAIFEAFPDLGIQPVCFRSFYMCTKCNAVVSDKVCPHGGGEHQVNFKGRVVRRMLAEGKVPEKQMRPEVAQKIIEMKELFVK
ncbi:sulfate adenylyltransferase [Candidatus Bathyarchaeota archaeon]|nr:sulfate adenylyltransferase [Candidatus Bathyarchaeota archaeon]